MEQGYYQNCLLSQDPKFIRVVIPGTPIPWMRPGINAGKIYDRQLKEKRDWQLQIKSELTRRDLLSGPLLLEVTFFMQIPVSLRPKEKARLYDKPHKKKPYLEDLLQFLCDASRILYTDDAQIAFINAKKIYADQPRTEFTLRELYGEENDEY